MLSGKEKIDLALRAGLVAESVLQLMRTGSKTHAKFILNQTAERFMELCQKIKEFPED